MKHTTRPLLLCAALSLSACASTAPTAASAQPASAPAYSLDFDPSRYQVQHITLNGQSLAVRAYEGLVYVRQPQNAQRQSLNLYVPEAYFNGGSVGPYNAQTAPIFLPNQIGGYMPASPGQAQPAAGQTPPDGSQRPNTIAAALHRGYVVASPGARGRTEANGKAPAAIVDLKAAVRWLRHNDARIPGSAEKIIANGTSAGGALAALLGASGNHPDYAPYLQALGAADTRDDILAVSAYCPITNLENADAAYEWQFKGVHDYKKIDITMLDYHVQRREVAGTLSAVQQASSAALAPRFAPYLNSLQLRSPQGQPLSLDAQGNGPFKDYVAELLRASAQQALDAGQNLSGQPWLRLSGARVQAVDFDAYARAAGRQKTPPAFDALDLSSGENQLFGNAQTDKRHFTAFSMQHSSAPGAQQADAATVRLMNPLHYLDVRDSTPARHWRVRHGTADRDTALAIPVILALRLQARGLPTDLALPWGRPHSGDYDLDELFAWIDQAAAAR